jgi:hypothetical protein
MIKMELLTFLSMIFTITNIALMISIIMIILLTFDIPGKKIYNNGILTAVAIVVILMIWSGLIDSSFILIPVLIIAMNGYIIIAGGLQ